MIRYPKFQGCIDRMSNNPSKYFISNYLHNGEKPLVVGDRVHLHTWEGCYSVHGVDAMFFVIKKNQEYYRIPWEDIRCKEGNRGSSAKSQVKSKIEKLQRELTQTLLELKRL